MNLTTFQTTIQGLVKAASGLTDAHAIWANQTRTRPNRPFVELAHLDEETTNFTDDTVSDTPSPTAGNEITLTTTEHTDLTIQIRVFSSEIVGSNNAFNIAQTIRRFFGRESTTAALGDIALVSREPVRDATIVLETEHEGRAVLTLKFRVADLETETTTYIETATVQTTVAPVKGSATQTLTITEG